MTRLEKLQNAIESIDKALELEAKKRFLHLMLKYELLKELHETSPTFWLDGKDHGELIKLFKEWDKLRQDIGLKSNFTYKWLSDDEVLVKMKKGHIGTITTMGIMNIGYDVVACRRERNTPGTGGYISYRWIRFKKRADGKKGEFL